MDSPEGMLLAEPMTPDSANASSGQAPPTLSECSEPGLLNI